MTTCLYVKIPRDFPIPHCLTSSLWRLSSFEMNVHVALICIFLPIVSFSFTHAQLAQDCGMENWAILRYTPLNCFCFSISRAQQSPLNQIKGTRRRTAILHFSGFMPRNTLAFLPLRILLHILLLLSKAERCEGGRQTTSISMTAI